jgi:pyruvate,water dikinase
MMPAVSGSGFKTLDDVGPEDRPSIGGKAFNCALLRQAGFPVPDGLIVPVTANDEALKQLEVDPWLNALPPDALFAVRSSGIEEDSQGQSFAGIHETRLNVDRAGLPEAVLACRRSAGSPQALEYRRARGLSSDAIGIGVLVQRMVAAVTSGVAFTTNPVTGSDELVINSSWGLGEAVVAGQVDPDEFIVRKADRARLATRLGAKGGAAAPSSSLTDAQIEALAALLVRIEQHYGAPQDVEWCHDEEQFWIVQSRPVTTARTSSASEPTLAEADIEWTRANLIEVLPDQTSPLARDAIAEMLNLSYRRYMGRLLAPESVLGPMVKAFHGRLYFNLSQQRHLFTVSRFPPADLMRALGHGERIRPEDEIVPRVPLGKRLRYLPDMVRVGVATLRAPQIFRRHQERMRQVVARLGAGDPRTMSDREVWDVIAWWKDAAPDHIEVVFVMGSVAFYHAGVRKACEKVGVPHERLMYSELAAGERSVSTEQAIALVALAELARHEPRSADYLRTATTFAGYREALAGTRFLDALDRFLDSYGHRGRYESDWALPRYREDPSPLLYAVGMHLQGPPEDLSARDAARAREAADAWRDFESHLTWWQRHTLLRRVRRTIRRLKQHYLWREHVRSDLARALWYIRVWHLTLADRFVHRGWVDRRDDYFLLLSHEIGAVIDGRSDPDRLRTIASERARELADRKHVRMPLWMRESELPALLRAPNVHASGDEELVGLCVSRGCVEGEVVVMRDAAEFARMKRGAILVAPATDPSWTPLFTLAAGVIVEIGGVLSHASTIAREYGLPALANVKDATRILRDGDRVRLDASAGRAVRLGTRTPGL